MSNHPYDKQEGMHYDPVCHCIAIVLYDYGNILNNMFGCYIVDIDIWLACFCIHHNIDFSSR